MSVDHRFRDDADPQPVEAGRFFRETFPERLSAHHDLVLPGARELRLADFCLEVEGEPWTLAFRDERFSIAPGDAGEAHARIDASQLADLVNDQTTPVAFMSSGVLDMPRGRLADFLNWWLVLRGALDGRRIHARGDVRLAVEPRSFTPDDRDEDMRAFLEEAGYLHIRGVFDEAEMAAVAADYERAAPHFHKGDPRAWFATTKDGVEHLVRMEGFDAYSDAASQLVEDDRFQRIGRIPGIGHVARRARGERVGALDKPIGVVKGISDVPWHKDCSLGRHSYECCSLTVGISVTGADAVSGQLRVVPGSHRALVWPAPCLQPGLDLEPLDLPTRTGDVTVHLSCTLHMSQPPEQRPRKVLYAGFGLRPRDAAAAEAARQKLHELRGKTHTTVSQDPGYLGD